MSNEAYEAGVAVALQEIAENLGEEFAEKIAGLKFWGKKPMTRRIKDKVKGGYSKSKKWLSKHPKSTAAGIAGLGGAAGYGGRMAQED